MRNFVFSFFVRLVVDLGLGGPLVGLTVGDLCADVPDSREKVIHNVLPL
jgi:hypothetical protein